jgi:hypothetical protein
VSTLLCEGKLQVECRIFGEGKEIENIFEGVGVKLWGKMSKRKKVLLGEKNISVNRNEF